MSDPQKPEQGRTKKASGRDGDPIVIKKYANRRLYNTASSTYVTLDYLSDMVKRGDDFVVYDAKTGDDITRSVLTQIIFEEENKGQNLLPIQFLRQLIQFYGDNLQNFVPSYLEMSMDAFARNQEQMRDQMRGAFGAAPGYNLFEETAKQNMALFRQAMQMFAAGNPASARMGEPPVPPSGDSEPAPSELKGLRDEIAALRTKLDKMENS